MSLKFCCSDTVKYWQNSNKSIPNHAQAVTNPGSVKQKRLSRITLEVHMKISLISIDRHRSHSYEWFISAGSEVHHSHFGQTNLTACLQGAAVKAPKENGMVEIIYRHIHMGTHMLEDILNDAERLARYIAHKYACLNNDPSVGCLIIEPSRPNSRLPAILSSM